MRVRTSPAACRCVPAACVPAAGACRDVAASYGVGALGGLVYLRLLNRSVDGVGGGLAGALGQQRLLIPIILALGYNRWGGRGRGGLSRLCAWLCACVWWAWLARLFGGGGVWVWGAFCLAITASRAQPELGIRT